jgi:ribonucleoside-diphosphate reductase alpha chain
MNCSVVKRRGYKESFDQGKLYTAIDYAFDDGIPDDEIIDSILTEIIDSNTQIISTEELNDMVERTLMSRGYFNEARNFILYREQHKNIRSMSTDNDTMSEYIFTNRYSRYLPRKHRRETWNEAVDRVRDMHLDKYPMISDEIIWSFEQVRQKRVLPSMRSMQFGGSPIKKKNERIYNCTASSCDRIKFFSETMELLLAGCGVGFDVTFDSLNKMPGFVIPDMKKIEFITIEDSIEGWADSIYTLINSYTTGVTIEFDYSKIRKSGSKIKSGGNAPGHVPLRRAIEKIRTIMDTIVERDGCMRPIEGYDITMHIADSVLSGGVRRSATLCLFSPDDDEMMNAKVGDWFINHPHRARSNNSVKLIRSETSKELFMRIFNKQKEFGEPGFYFVEDNSYLTNPCCEIGLNAILPKGHEMPDGSTLPEDTSGFSFCNLTTVNGSMLKTMEDFEKAVRAATIIGTCQAGYTNFKYHDSITEEIVKRESLLGVSITGIMDSPEITLVPENLNEMADLTIEVNKDIAKKIGINPASRLTTVKPEGSTSILLNTASGIHPRYAKRYFRRIQANKNDPVYKHFKEKNPHCCEQSVWSNNGTDDVITFCVESPKDCIVKDDLTALEFLEIVKMVQENWVIRGTANPDTSPGLTHNVSNTVTVSKDEWDDVADFIYENRKYFTGVSLIPDNGDTIYEQAPHQMIRGHDDEATWTNYIESYEKVDYTKLNEDEDVTNHKSIIVCAGGTCDISIEV